MRTEILNYIRGQNLGVFTTSTEVPWSENGVPLYIKNLKKVYVDQEQVELEPLVTTLNAININTEVSSVTVYLACDAKQPPSNLSDVVTAIRSAKDAVQIDGVRRKECTVSTEYQADVLVTALEFRFTKLT